ncbi:MAG: spore coat protein [Clostridia bacterium]|jgi:spore coat protein CotF|nr:spore coat protein [Clostridia bacterium]
MDRNYKPESLNERELLTDLLHTEKNMTTTYAGSCTEASSPQLRQVLTRNMTECANDQLCVFEEMRKRSLYNPKTAQQQDVQKAKQEMLELQNETW